MRYGLLVIICLIIQGAALAQTADSTPTPTALERVEPEWDGTFRRIRVPILMYHYVSDAPEDADEYRIDLSVTPDMFRAHMDALYTGGYTPVSLYYLDAALLTGAPLPDNPVVLTFDDGYSDHYDNVFPVLQQYNFTGTFFVITETADDSNPAHVSWGQVREMSDAGMDMESHTKTHSDLRGGGYDFLVYELLGAIESLQAYTGRTPHMLAYPGGRYDDAVLDVVRTLPVWRAVTTEPGVLHTTDNRLEMTRQRIHHETGVAGLMNLLAGN
ncbi:MAG: polysaccharide deacetylase family protein [Anaerolineae bacterium]|nr:polysaccharide deacetylase family protein [Anaerolineae bacterium]